VILERTEAPGWLSNSYLLADGPGGSAILVDGNGVAEPLLERIERDALTVARIVLTHHHVDHVTGIDALKERFGVPVLAHAATARALGDGLVDHVVEDGEIVRAGELEVRVLHTPGHAAGHLALLVNEADCLTADVLFKGTVGGTRAPGATGFADLRRSIMDRLMALDPAVRIHPGHVEPSTIGAEWEANPFVRLWRGLDPEGAEPCRVGGEAATLVLWAPDYDGTHKAWVRFPSGEDAIVGGSRVQRG
jgi:glyoxylase-like metal-dependent hydrolase (beta-lactamase superfamily II)